VPRLSYYNGRNYILSNDIENWLNFWQRNPQYNFNAFYSNLKEDILNCFRSLGMTEKSTILVPLCGKTHDLIYFSELGYNVFGVEISSIAIKQFFIENNLNYKIEKVDLNAIYSATNNGVNIQIYCGNIFDLIPSNFSPCDTFYDVAGLYALPKESRKQYVCMVKSLLIPSAKGVLTSVSHNLPERNSAPYSINNDEINYLFGESFFLKKKGEYDVIPNDCYQKNGFEKMSHSVYELILKSYSGVS